MSAVAKQDIGTAQRLARESFDLEAFMASLPPPPPPPEAATTHGTVGRRLRGHLTTTLPDDALRAFASEYLGAQRMSQDYLQALRVVLGNQAKAELWGYVLELNIRTGFATERVMRNIIDQMKAAGITSGIRVGLGCGRTQVIQVFTPAPRPPPDLCEVLRWEEQQPRHHTVAATIPKCISGADVPY